MKEAERERLVRANQDRMEAREKEVQAMSADLRSEEGAPLSKQPAIAMRIEVYAEELSRAESDVLHFKLLHADEYERRTSNSKKLQTIASLVRNMKGTAEIDALCLALDQMQL